MSNQITSLTAIHEFLSHRRIALVGISHDPKDFSVTLFNELRRRGYDVIPVNPRLSEVEGGPCFARVQDIQPPVEAALVMTSPTVTDEVVRDCAEAGIRHVWMYAAGLGGGSVSVNAILFCQEHGIEVVPGECPYMFLSGAGFGHRLHGFVRKITGHYPQEIAA
jgi:uncharacterized protein